MKEPRTVFIVFISTLLIIGIVSSAEDMSWEMFVALFSLLVIIAGLLLWGWQRHLRTCPKCDKRWSFCKVAEEPIPGGEVYETYQCSACKHTVWIFDRNIKNYHYPG